MLDYDYLIIGGGIAGTSAAETIRRADASARIAILEAEPDFLYSKVLLPDFVKGEVDLNKVMLRSIVNYEKNRIDFYPETVVSKIDFGRRDVFADERVFSYEKLLIASGGKVKVWKFEAGFPDKVFRLQTLVDATRLKEFLERRKPARALVVGGGFIAIEFMNIFKHFGIQTKLLSRDRFFWANFLDERGHSFLDNIFGDSKIEIVTSDEVREISEREDDLEVLTQGGAGIATDIVAAGIGLLRNFDFAGGVLNTGRGIFVDEFMLAEFKSGLGGNVWAAGDAAEYVDPYSGRRKVFGNWTHGFLTGHAAGLSMTGSKKPFRSVASYSVSFLGVPVAVIGTVDNQLAEEAFSDADNMGRKYGRFFLKGGKLIGALLLGAQKDTPRVIKMIESGEIIDRNIFKFT